MSPEELENKIKAAILKACPDATDVYAFVHSGEVSFEVGKHAEINLEALSEYCDVTSISLDVVEIMRGYGFSDLKISVDLKIRPNILEAK